jgi:hypothetical protein
VLAYRGISPHVRQRLGRGNAAVAFMRLGNAEEAKAASEQIGTEHRFVLSQLTETIGVSVTDTTGSAYTSTVGSASSTATSSSESEGVSRSSGHGHSDGSLLLPSRASFSRSVQAGDSRTTSETESVSASVSTSTAWGMTTSKAAGDSESLALALQRSREFLVEQHELQQLPASAMIITYAGPAGRQVVLADANPGIGGLATATPLTLEESRGRPAAELRPAAAGGPASSAALPESSGDEEVREPAGRGDAAPGAASWRSGPGRPPPNLGPPPPRLDWRKRRS